MRRRQASLPHLETPDAKRLFVETIIPDMPLSYWDTQTLRYLLPWLDSNSVLTLLRTGDILLATKLHTQITSLHYTKQNLERSPEPPRWVPVLVSWEWPSLLAASSLQQLTTLLINDTRHALSCDLSVLPPTLTKLALVGLSLVIHSDKCLQFHLPNLQHLRLDRILLYMVGTEVQIPIVQLRNAISESPHISTFRYTPSTMPSSLCDTDVSDFLELLPMLQKLSVPYLNYQINHWPPGLHTICLHRYHNGIFSTRGSLLMPPSIKTLIIQDSMPLQVIHRILGSTPASLTCLEANLLYKRDDTTINEIARFTQLQSLHLPRYAELAQMKTPLKCDLPPSLTALSESFAIHPPSWAYISPNVKIMNRKPFDSSKSPYEQAICIYDHFEHEDYAPYFPMDLGSILLIDSNVPVPNTRLRSVGMRLNQLDAFSRRECATLFTNMPRTLTSLKIEVLCAPALIWLDGFDEMSEPASSRFPCLKHLCLMMWFGLSADHQHICEWLTHLPHTLERLSLEIRNKGYYPQAPLVELSTLVLPPNLTSLKLKLGSFLMDMPVVLPSHLMKIHLRFYAIINAKSYEHIASWPATLCKIHLHGLDEAKSKQYLTPALATFGQRNNGEPDIRRGAVEESGRIVSYVIARR